MTEIIKKNDVIELEISDINNLGNGVGRYPDGSGLVVFVRGAVSGDRVRAKVIKVNSAFAVARLEAVLRPSANRSENDLCSAPLSCGGCVYRHITYKHELELKQGYVRSAFAKAGLGDAEILPVMSTGKIKGYRNKGQYPVAKTKAGIAAGFYAARTHNIIPAEDCSIQNARFGEILRAVCSFADENGWSVYEEESGRGLLRHIYMRVGEATGEIMVCLVVNGESLPNEDKLVHMLTERFSSIVSVMINTNKENTNVVLGKKYRTLYGKDGIEDVLCGLRFFISPESFYQVNREAAEMLYNKARALADLKGDELLCDLYCGTGTIGLSMARDVRELCGIEIVEGAVECAKENARRNNIENARFYCADAGSAESILRATGGRTPDAVMIDPPRKGSTPELAECLSSLGVPKIVYISCNPDTLARDAVYFIERGYTMGKVQPVDLFPRTGHVETIVCFDKQ